MKKQDQFLLFTTEEFDNWLMSEHFNRQIKRIQNHHTYMPDYKSFNGSNHFKMLESMRNYHVNTQKYQDIAQNLTTFPDGTIAVCRNFNTVPAGIYGANEGALCIENVGNFDFGKDAMTEEHKKSIIFLNASLCKRFNITPDTNNIIYHHWYDMSTGKRTNGTGSTKTCPGTNFFGGNTVEAAQKYFISLIEELLRGSGKELTLLQAKNIIQNSDYWAQNAVLGKLVKGEYARILIMNYVSLHKKVDTLNEAVSFMVENGMLNSPEYWLENAVENKTVNGEYAGALIKKIAACL